MYPLIFPLPDLKQKNPYEEPLGEEWGLEQPSEWFSPFSSESKNTDNGDNSKSQSQSETLMELAALAKIHLFIIIIQGRVTRLDSTVDPDLR